MFAPMTSSLLVVFLPTSTISCLSSCTGPLLWGHVIMWRRCLRWLLTNPFPLELVVPFNQLFRSDTHAQGARTVRYSVSLDLLYGEDARLPEVAACNKGDNIS